MLRKTIPYLSVLICIGLATLLAFSFEKHYEVVRIYDMDDNLLREKTMYRWTLAERIAFGIVFRLLFGYPVYLITKDEAKVR